MFNLHMSYSYGPILPESFTHRSRALEVFQNAVMLPRFLSMVWFILLEEEYRTCDVWKTL